MNNDEREMWVRNHEPLYEMWLKSGLSMTRFLKERRSEIDLTINFVTRPNGHDERSRG